MGRWVCRLGASRRDDQCHFGPQCVSRTGAQGFHAMQSGPRRGPGGLRFGAAEIVFGAALLVGPGQRRMLAKRESVERSGNFLALEAGRELGAVVAIHCEPIEMKSLDVRPLLYLKSPSGQHLSPPDLVSQGRDVHVVSSFDAAAELRESLDVDVGLVQWRG